MVLSGFQECDNINQMITSSMIKINGLYWVWEKGGRKVAQGCKLMLEKEEIFEDWKTGISEESYPEVRR